MGSLYRNPIERVEWVDRFERSMDVVQKLSAFGLNLTLESFCHREMLFQWHILDKAAVNAQTADCLEIYLKLSRRFVNTLKICIMVGYNSL